MQASNELILSADFDRNFFYFIIFTPNTTQFFAVKGFFPWLHNAQHSEKGGKAWARKRKWQPNAKSVVCFSLYLTVLGKLFLRYNKFGQKRWEIYWTAKYFLCENFNVFRDLLSSCFLIFLSLLSDIRTQTIALSACNWFLLCLNPSGIADVDKKCLWLKSLWRILPASSGDNLFSYIHN